MNKTLLHSATGLFVLAALFTAGLAVVGRPTLQGWLGTVRKCEAWLPEAYVGAGDAVEFRSFRVGRVVGVEPHLWDAERGENWFRVRLNIDDAWSEAITDAFAVTVSIGPLGALTGSKLVLLAPGETRTRDPKHPATLRGRTLASYSRATPMGLPFQQPESLLDELTHRARALLDELGPKANEVFDTLRDVSAELARPEGDLFTFVRQLRQSAERLDAPIDDAQRVLAEARALLQTLNDPAGSVQLILAQAASIGAGLERGEGVVGELLREGELKAQTVELFQRTNQLLADTSEVLQRTRATLADVNASSSELPAMAERLGAVVARIDSASRTLPGLAEEVRRTLEQTNSVLLGLRESPLLNVFADFAPPAPAAPLVLPAALGAGGR